MKSGSILLSKEKYCLLACLLASIESEVGVVTFLHFFIHVYVCMYVCVSYVYEGRGVLLEARRMYQLSWSWSDRVSPSVWMLGTKLGPLERAVCTWNCWAVFPVPSLSSLKGFFLQVLFLFSVWPEVIKIQMLKKGRTRKKFPWIDESACCQQ